MGRNRRCLALGDQFRVPQAQAGHQQAQPALEIAAALEAGRADARQGRGVQRGVGFDFLPQLGSAVGRLEAAPLQEVADWVEPYQRYWFDRYERLDLLLNTLQGNATTDCPSPPMPAEPF